jgi:hypothetical protein
MTQSKFFLEYNFSYDHKGMFKFVTQHLVIFLLKGYKTIMKIFDKYAVKVFTWCP